MAIETVTLEGWRPRALAIDDAMRKSPTAAPGMA